MKLEPIDYLIKEGLAKSVSRQFRAPTSFLTSPDKLTALQVAMQNAPIKYPYIFLNMQTWNAASDRYNSNRLARTGVVVATNTDNTQVHYVRVIPVNFDVEVTFITNLYSNVDTDSAEGFARRWMFMRRNGSVNFTVNYGLCDFPITYTANESVQLPPRESQTDQESVYQVTSSLVLQGYISEPVLGTRGRVNQVILSDSVPTLGQAGERFYPFPTRN